MHDVTKRCVSTKLSWLIVTTFEATYFMFTVISLWVVWELIKTNLFGWNAKYHLCFILLNINFKGHECNFDTELFENMLLIFKWNVSLSQGVPNSNLVIWNGGERVSNFWKFQVKTVKIWNIASVVGWLLIIKDTLL